MCSLFGYLSGGTLKLLLMLEISCKFAYFRIACNTGLLIYVEDTEDELNWLVARVF